MKVSTIRLVIACAFGLTQPAWAQVPFDRSFSSLCTDPNGGDIGGLRIKVAGAMGATAVTFEEPEGALLAPIPATDVAFDAANGKLTFRVPTEGGRLSFEGTVGTTTLDGTLKRADGDAEPIHLPLDKGGDGETACPASGDPVKP